MLPCLTGVLCGLPGVHRVLEVHSGFIGIGGACSDPAGPSVAGCSLESLLPFGRCHLRAVLKTQPATGASCITWPAAVFPPLRGPTLLPMGC